MRTRGAAGPDPAGPPAVTDSSLAALSRWMAAPRYELATVDGDLLHGWSAALVEGRAGTVRLDARYAASCGGWLRISVDGLRAVPMVDGGSQTAGEERLGLQAMEHGTSLEFEAARVGSAAEVMAAGRGLCRCLDEGRIVLIEACGARVHGTRFARGDPWLSPEPGRPRPAQ